MRPGLLEPYESALRSESDVRMWTADGRPIEMDVPRWIAAADGVDETVLVRCSGPVLDIGCGPGRLVHSLVERGVEALGIDIAAAAVSLSQHRGAPALRCDVFGFVPRVGQWDTALLIDGNVGINGDIRQLLARVAILLAPGGRLICEANGTLGQDEVMRMRFGVGDQPSGGTFDWAFVDSTGLQQNAIACGYDVVDSWSAGGRSFVELCRAADRAIDTA